MLHPRQRVPACRFSVPVGREWNESSPDAPCARPGTWPAIFDGDLSNPISLDRLLQLLPQRVDAGSRFLQLACAPSCLAGGYADVLKGLSYLVEAYLLLVGSGYDLLEGLHTQFNVLGHATNGLLGNVSLLLT